MHSSSSSRVSTTEWHCYSAQASSVRRHWCMSWLDDAFHLRPELLHLHVCTVRNRSVNILIGYIFCLSISINCMGQNIKSLEACFCVCVRAPTGFEGRISRKRLEIEVRLQWDTNRKWHMAYRLVTWPMTSRDLERSRSWPSYKNAHYLENGWR